MINKLLVNASGTSSTEPRMQYAASASPSVSSQPVFVGGDFVFVSNSVDAGSLIETAEIMADSELMSDLRESMSQLASGNVVAWSMVKASL